MKTYDGYKEYFEDSYLKFLPEIDDNAKLLRESMEYSLASGGKRLRPVLLLAAYDSFADNIDEAMPYAFAMECIHTFSLIHDDLPAMDDDDLRRGKPTNHIVYGAGIATLAGDALLALAFSVMLDDMAEKAAKGHLEGRAKAAGLIADSTGMNGMTGGQACDLESEGKNVEESVLSYIQENKTAALIKASVLSGLYIADADEKVCDAFTEYADNLGRAFQVADDILDVTASQDEFGKPVGSDEEEHKLTYVSMFGIDGAREKLREFTSASVNSISQVDKEGFFTKLSLDLEKRTK